MNKEITDNSLAGFMKSISLLHIALFSGQIITAAIMLYLKGSYTLSLSNTEGPFLYVVPGAAVMALFLGKKLYDSRLAAIGESMTLQQKLETYKSALIINLALIEGASLLGIMVYYITGNLLHLLIGFVLVIYFFYLKPTITGISRDAKLSNVEIEEIS